MGQQLNFGGIPAAGAAAPPAKPGAAAPPPESPALKFDGIPATNETPAAPPQLGGVLGPAVQTVVDANRKYQRAGAEMVMGMDPRTPEGRQNLAGAAGGAIGAYMTGGTSWIYSLLGPTLAAGAGGAIAEEGEQALGTHPRSTLAKARAGATQSAYELGGKLLLWPLRAAATRFVAARRVAGQAREAVETGLRSAKTAATDAMDLVRERGRQFVAGAEGRATAATRAAQQAAKLDVEAATMKGAREIADAQSLYDALIKDAPSILDAGQKVRRVVQPRDVPGIPKGPAQRALDAAGAQVAKAAETGPGIAIRPVQQALDRMANQARPAAIFNAGGTPGDAAQIGFLQTIKQKLTARNPAAAGIPPGQPGHVLHADLETINKEIAKQLGVAEGHPLPGILGKIATMPDGTVLSFSDAHQLKKLLDESVNWDRTASKHVEQITKGLRQTLREMLSVHEPYNAATRAFEQVVPLYRKSVGKQLIKDALGDPDKVVRALSAKDPARAQMVKDLLVGQSFKGGDPELGQQAWQAIQSAWVYNHIIRGGPEKLSQRLATVLTENPEFSRIVLGDDTAKKVLSNIDMIGTAYQQAEQAAGDMLLTAKQSGAAGVQAAKDAGASQVRAAKLAATDAARVERRAQNANIEAAAATRDKFRNSSIAQYAQPLSAEHTAADVARVAALGPKTFTGSLALIRLLKGPKSSELVEWAAMSDRNTQRLVQALTSNVPATAVADLLREMAAHVGGLGGSADATDGRKSATVPASGRR